MVTKQAKQPRQPAVAAEDALIALRQILRTTDLRSRQVSRDTGVTTPQLLILRAIAALGEVTTGRLAAHVNLSQPTVTAIVDRLSARGLIDRYRSEADRRVVHNRLTREGRKVMNGAPPLLHEEFMERFRRLPEARQQEMVQTLREIAGMMGVDSFDVEPVLTFGAAVEDNGEKVPSH